MIRHRPFGLGHPYRVELDQRVPARPVEGVPTELRATTPPQVRDLAVELTVNGRTRMASLQRVARREPASGDAGAGHLDAAAVREAASNRRAWSHVLHPLPAGTRIVYRFIGDEGRQRTRWFETVVAGWSPAGGRLHMRPIGSIADNLDPGSVA